MVTDGLQKTDRNECMKEYNWRQAPYPIDEHLISKTLDADVVVIGMGCSGIPALRAAAECGAKTIGVEVRSERGCGVICSEIGHINSAFLKSRGVDMVDPLELLDDWQRRTLNRSDPKLVLLYAEKSGESFDWLIEPASEEHRANIRVKHLPASVHRPKSVSGFKTWLGTARLLDEFGYSATELMRDNIKVAREHGAQILWKTRALQLERNDERITGVIVSDQDGNYMRLNAAKAVILAAGGFSRNPAMVRDLCVEMTSLSDGEEITGAGRDGSGIQMGYWAGGRLAPQPMAYMGGNYFYPNGIIGNAAVMWLDQTGRRYCNEGFGDMVYSGVAGTRLAKGARVTAVFDSKILEHLEYQQTIHCALEPYADDVHSLLKQYMTSAQHNGDEGVRIRSFGFAGKGHDGYVTLYAGRTPEELAKRLGYRGAALDAFVNELSKYNGYCRTGRDEDFGKDPQLLLTLESPPYFGFSKDPYLGNEFLCTCDGLWIDESLHVLNQEKKPMKGLYAVGNNGGRIFGIQYSTPISGVCFGAAITFGRLAGMAAAKEDKHKCAAEREGLVKAVIFDLDGVVVSTDYFHQLAWKETAEEEGISLSDEILPKLRGVGRIECAELIFAQAGRSGNKWDVYTFAQKKNAKYIDYLTGLTPNDILPGVLDFLAKLKRERIATAIASSSKNAKMILEKTGLIERFDVIVDGSMICNTKPDPEVFLKAAQLLHVSPEECVVVEDAEAGIQGAKACAMRTVAVGHAGARQLGDLNLDGLLGLETEELPFSGFNEKGDKNGTTK